MIGRVFWRGALERLAPELATDALFEVLLDRDFIGEVERSAIPGDHAYQFSHVLIRDVAYAGMTKAERAENHQRFAEWIEERVADDLVEVRAHHLDRAAALVAELDGSVPARARRPGGRSARAGRRVRATAATRSPMPGGSSGARWSSNRAPPVATSPPTPPAA